MVASVHFISEVKTMWRKSSVIAVIIGICLAWLLPVTMLVRVIQQQSVEPNCEMDQRLDLRCIGSRKNLGGR